MGEDGSLFDRVLVVSFTPGSKKPEITYRFPPREDKKDVKDTLADSVSDFCYPETHNELVLKASSSNYSSETFSFVLTDSLGGKTYGYCRRFKTENDQLECFCILSHSPSFSLFSQILDIVESRRKVSSSLVFSFLKTVLAQIFPAPGETLSVKTFSSSKNGGMDVYNLTRPADEYLMAFVSFYSLFQSLDLEIILKVWEYLLCERRVIFCSKNLGTLSSCIYALCALLYPFTWQHIFIPILPQALIHFVTAPMPFLVGILSSSKSLLNGIPLDEVIMLDLDEKEFTLDHPFEKTLPLPQFCTLKNNLRKLLRSGKKDKDFDQEVAHYFLLFFYTIFRDYKKYISPAKPEAIVQEDVKEATNPKKKPIKRRTPKGDFDRAAFMKSHNEDSTQKFLELFGSAQMFEAFIQEREEMAGVGSGPLKDCHFLTLCSDTLNESEYSGTATCEVCAKQSPLKHSCAYDAFFFHPPCFVCKRCHLSMVFDDFNSCIVQVTGSLQESAHKVRLVCASCDSQGKGSGSSGSGGSGAANFLKRMKNAVAHKMEVTSPKQGNRLNMFKRDKKDEVNLDKPTTPPPREQTPATSPTAASTPSPSTQATPALAKSHSGELMRQQSPRVPLRKDAEQEKRISNALRVQFLSHNTTGTPRQSLPSKDIENPTFFKSKFKSVQLHREPAIANIKVEDYDENFEKKPEKRRSRSDIFPANYAAEKAKYQSSSATASKTDDDVEMDMLRTNRISVLKEHQMRSVSPKPLPSVPRAIRTKLVPPNPAIFVDTSGRSPNGTANATPANGHASSDSVVSSVSSNTSSSSGSLTDTLKPPPVNKPKSNSGSAATPSTQTQTISETKPKSGSFNRTQPTVPSKPRSGSGPTAIPNALPLTQPSSSPTETTETTSKPRSGSVGRAPQTASSTHHPLPVPPSTINTTHEPTLMSQHRSNSGPNVPATQSSSTAPTLATSKSSPVKQPAKQVPVSTAPPSVHTNKTPPANKSKLHPAPSETRPSLPTPAVKTSRPVPPRKATGDKRLQTNDILLEEPPAPACALCGLAFNPDSDSPDAAYRIISTNDAYFHPECFLCKECGKLIETSYVTRDGNSYHRDCAANIAQTCKVCNKPILSQYLELKGKVLHKECFTCTSCKEPLAKVGSKYVELDGYTYCMECTKTRSSTKQ